MDTMMWVLLAIGLVFFGILLYSRQFNWLLKVGRNMILGTASLLGANALLAGVGLAVGVNIITALIIGVLGIPGFMMLYLAQLLIGR